MRHIDKNVLLLCVAVVMVVALLSLKEAKAEFEKDYLQGTLEACDWNVREAARALGIHRSVLYAKIEKYDLTKKQRKS